MKLVWIAALSVLGCTAKQTPPYVQDSFGGTPAAVVKITNDGLDKPCVVVDVGETVEWRNLQPAIPANVTGFGNDELYSPSLVEGGPIATEKVEKVVERFAYWRHTFRKPGVFEYFDTNRGEPGRKVVDPYYGTVSYVGVSSTLETGVVCVQQAGSDQCTAVCCLKDKDDNGIVEQNECPSSQCCDKTKGKRCLQGAPTAPICSAGIGSVKQAAFRNFECFADADCKPDSTGAVRICVTNHEVSHVCRVKK